MKNTVRIFLKRTGCMFTLRMGGKLCRVHLTKTGTYRYEGSKEHERQAAQHAQKALEKRLPKTDPLTLYLKDWPKATMQLIDYHRMLGDMLRIDLRVRS